ncbi:beta-galactosidase (plasmid) [Hymenobacter tibetensis]|uniref:Beta-galactosidase n=1 Tax=Hymenobacter tibetensis TaxID=497967 RepID=A0ABY4D593_9BACT|nr:beta-galactosidase [Hymenobacter tibetensis]UOG77372.1 beta-galactosidase [Hymenobacter tibetensis]
MLKLTRTWCLLGALLAAGLSAPAQQKHTFEIQDGQFKYDGQPTPIYSGEMHYARVPRPYWRHRLQMMKAMGLNTVATYVFWNYHHPSPGVWDFSTGNRNLAEFVRTAQQEGMFVILRPGPYTCAEWEFGGYPWWLQQNKDLVIRANNKPFLDSCRVYLGKLAEQVRSLQVRQGGPIILTQVENEFGSYVLQRPDIPLAEHQQYNAAIRKQLADVGFEGPFFTSDASNLFNGGSTPGALPTANGEDDVARLRQSVNQFHDNKGPYMVAEYYPGWLDHWGEPFVRVTTEKVVKQVATYLQNGVNFNFYMVHGGTNFGFTAGANYDKNHDIQPDITSYDYDAPISEAGWATPKYKALRELMLKHVKYPVPAVPAPLPVLSLPPIAISKAVSLFDLKRDVKPVRNDTPLTFEALGQGHGYVLYSRKFRQAAKGNLQVKGLRDFATVYVNGRRVGELSRQKNTYTLAVDVPAGATLELLVENMGRINYGALIVQNTKGIIEPVLLNDAPVTGNWEMYRMPFEQVPNLSAYRAGKSPAGQPTLYSGTFKVEKPGDVFLDMRGWGKGLVFVNGQSLGRFWRIGPQQTLYLPGSWLRQGQNEVVILEQLNDAPQKSLKTIDKPIIDDVRL